MNNIDQINVEYLYHLFFGNEADIREHTVFSKDPLKVYWLEDGRITFKKVIGGTNINEVQLDNTQNLRLLTCLKYPSKIDDVKAMLERFNELYGLVHGLEGKNPLFVNHILEMRYLYTKIKPELQQHQKDWVIANLSS